MEWVLLIGAVILLLSFSVFFGAPYVPSQRRYLERAFEKLYKVGPDDLVVDIGSGEGLVLRAAARRGARAIGFEINPVFVLLSMILSIRFPTVTVRWRDFWRTPLPAGTTLVYLFGVGRDNSRIVRKLRREADRLGRPLHLMCLGNPLKGMEPIRSLDAYALYRFEPLQGRKA